MVDVVAHRGDSLRFRENTIPAIRSAMSLGVDRIEIDVRTTADGVSIVLHDRTLLRLWGIPATVGDLPWDVVRQVGYADQRIPRLEDVADLLCGSGVGLLVDTGGPDDALAAWRALDSRRARRGDGALEVHWCGHPDAMAAVRELDPDAVLHLATETGWADPELVATLRPRWLNMEGSLLSPEVSRRAHEQGLAISVWTIDDPVPMAALAAFGADSVTTNRPGLLMRLRADGSLDSGAALLAGWSGGGGGGGEDPDLGSLDPVARSRAALVAGDLAAWAASYLRESQVRHRSFKSHPADLVTDVDQAVERRVREVLGACFPEHAVVGEEEGGVARPGHPTWYLDPVDGTTNYAHGLAWSSFSLALAVDRTPVVGVVADPWRGEVLAAVAGQGATRDGMPMHLAATAGVLPGSVVLTEWNAHEPFAGQLDVLARLAAHHVTTRIMGSGTLSCAAVAAGRGAGCLIGDFHAEDHLAATLIAREAGAVILDADGAAVTWPKGPFLVCHPALADELYAAWVGDAALRPDPAAS